MLSRLTRTNDPENNNIFTQNNKTNVVPLTGRCSVHEAMLTSSDS